MAVWRRRVLARVSMVPVIPVGMALASPAPLAGLELTAIAAIPPRTAPSAASAPVRMESAAVAYLEMALALPVPPAGLERTATTAIQPSTTPAAI